MSKKSINVSEFKNYAVVKSHRNATLTPKGAVVYEALKAFAVSHNVGDTCGLGKYLERYAETVKKNLTVTKFVTVKDVQNACDVLNGTELVHELQSLLPTESGNPPVGKLQIYGDLTAERSVASCYIRIVDSDALEFAPEKKETEGEKSASVATPKEQAVALAKQLTEIDGLKINDYFLAIIDSTKEKYGAKAVKEFLEYLANEMTSELSTATK